MAWPAVAMAAGAVLGGISGGQKKGEGSFSDTQSTSDIFLKGFNELNKGRSELEAQSYTDTIKQYNDLQGLIGQGPGTAEVGANTQFQNQFASQLQQMLNRTMNPTQANISEDFASARSLFAPQQEALRQNFQDQEVSSSRLAARLGRAGNDPILRNKLGQEQTRQQRSLDAEIGSYAQQMPDIQAGRMMNLGGYLSNLRSGLATQALQNRQTLLGLGQALTKQERDYRVQTARRTGSTTSTEETSSGGGTMGAISGAIAGAGQGIGLMKSFGAQGVPGEQTGTFGMQSSSGRTLMAK